MSTLPSEVAVLIERFARNRDGADQQINRRLCDLHGLADREIGEIEAAT
jgi:hypothetical protein